MMQSRSTKRKKAKLNEDIDVSDCPDDVPEEAVVDREEMIKKEISTIKPITRDMQVVQTFVSDPWLEAEDKTAADWTFNYSARTRCRLFTFKDLWNHNFLLTEGSKFGGDFLVSLCGAVIIIMRLFTIEGVYRRPCHVPCQVHPHLPGGEVRPRGREESSGPGGQVQARDQREEDRAVQLAGGGGGQVQISH